MQETGRVQNFSKVIGSQDHTCTFEKVIGNVKHAL